MIHLLFSRTYATNGRCVYLRHRLKIDGWSTKQKKSTYVLESFSYQRTISKTSSLGRFDSLKNYHIHNDKNIIDDICDWLRGSNIKMPETRYRGGYFCNIENLKIIEKIKLSYNILNKCK